ncbi:ionotropic receptor 75a-like [Phlebotomus argentipes]|uniref:ionotropic receptor 75a-like n=1 Tax=Phlebotomus argentipes TaxID=94469 RepID=UPI002892F389|nr:ionotropic receptor 75a-like [Phlebotomus argentipes]
MSEKNKFNETFVWILYSSATLEENLNLLATVKMQWDSEVFLLSGEFEENPSLLRVSELYRVKFDPLYPISVNLVGFWDGKLFNVSQDFRKNTKLRRRLDLKGVEIYGAVAIKRVSPGLTAIEMLQSRMDSSLASSAFQYAVLLDIMRRANATFMVRRTSSWSKLNKPDNESWEGPMAMINASLVDLSISPMSITPNRLPYVYATPNTWQAHFGFVFRHPRSVSVRDVFLQPFSEILWVCTIAMLTLLWGAFIASLKLNYSGDSLGVAFLGIFGTFFQQSFSMNLRMTSARILLVLALIFSFISYQFYTTFIVASLITEAPKTIRTVEDIAASKLRLGANDLEYNEGFFNYTPLTIKLYKERIRGLGNLFTPEKGIQLIKKGGFAFHFDVESTYEGIVQTFSEGEICDLQEIIFLPVVKTSAVVRKTSPFRELINVLTRRLTEVGVVQQEHSKWFASRPKCVSRVTVIPVDLEHVFTPIMIIVVASVTSVIILAVEIYTKRRHIEFLEAMSEKNKFNETFVWILYSSATLEENLNLLATVKMQWDSEVFLLSGEFEENPSLLRVSELYRVKFDPLYPISVNLVGFWDGKLFNVSQDFRKNTKLRRRLDLKGAEIYGAVSIKRVCLGLTAFEMLQTRVDSSTASSAFQFALLQDIMRRANATFVVRRTSSWSKFHKEANESWDGPMAMLSTSLADLSITPLTLTLDRIPYVYATPITWQPQFGFVFRHPRSASVRDLVLQPFSDILWVCTIAMLTLLWGAFIASLKLNYSGDSLGVAFLGIFGTFFQQSFSVNLRMTSARILLVLALIFSFISYQFYTTFIVASLITEAPKTIRTVEDIAASKLRLGANDIEYNEDLFNYTQLTRKLYRERIKTPGQFFSPRRGIQLIKKGGFAFHFDVESTYEGIVQTFSEDEICDLQEVKFLPVISTSALVRKTSPFRELINVLTRRLTEVGVVQQEHSKWFASRPKCVSRVTVIPVDLEHVFTPIMIIVVASVTSVIILAVEIYTKRRQ